MRSSDAIAMLAHQVRTLLIQAPTSALPMTYQQVANALGLTPPRTIARVTQALEQLMEQDVAAGRPMIAALVISRRGRRYTGQRFFPKSRRVRPVSERPRPASPPLRRRAGAGAARSLAGAQRREQVAQAVMVDFMHQVQ